MLVSIVAAFVINSLIQRNAGSRRVELDQPVHTSMNREADTSLPGLVDSQEHRAHNRVAVLGS